MNCRICLNESGKIFKAKVLNKYDADYYFCKNCNFLFAGDPFWLNEAYQKPINISDTGIMNRNIHYSKIVSVLLYFFFGKNAKYLDYAGGYGIFTRLMRDIGFDFYWQDPYCENLLARGFEYDESMKTGIQLVTAFEVFEHLVNPLYEIKKMFDISENIIFSTILLPEPIPKPENWWYYGLEHGQHVAFYSEKTLRFIAEKFKVNYYKINNLHLYLPEKLNEPKLSLLALLLKFGIFALVKKIMRSRISDDYLKMKESLL